MHWIHVAFANPAVLVSIIAVETFGVVRISVAIVLGHELLLLVHGVSHSVPFFTTFHVLPSLWLHIVKDIGKITHVVHLVF